MRAWVAMVAGLVGWSCVPRQPTFAIAHREQRGRLERNGLRFVIMPDATTDLVEVSVRYEVGAAEDPAGKSGLAHLVEHLMFDVRPEGEDWPLSHYLGKVAVSWNAYTNYDSTHYMSLASRRNLDSLLQVEAMRLFYGCRTIPEGELVREREVVRNELRQRRESDDALLEPALVKALYPKGHAYAHDIGGADADLTDLTLEDACAFVEHYYVPARAVVVVTGAVDVNATVGMIEKWFGKLEPRPAAPLATIAPITLSRARTTIDLDIDRPIVAVSWALPPLRSAADEALRFSIMERLAVATHRSRMYEKAIRGGFLELGGRGAPVITLVIELDTLDHLDDALGFVWKAARRLYLEPGADDVAEQRSRIKTEVILGLENLDARANEVADLIQFRPAFDFATDQPYVFRELDAIGQLDLEGVDATAREVVDPDAAQVTVFRPTRARAGERHARFDFAASTHDFGTPDVDPTEARHRLDLPAQTDRLAGAKRFQLDNGMAVVLLPIEHAPLPIVSVQLSIAAGDAASPEHPMVPLATADLAHPPALYAERLARAGIDIGCRTTPDHTICSARSVSIYLSDLVEGLERTLKLGSYNQGEIESLQKLTADVAQHRSQIEDNEFERQGLDAIFGADHPYARSGVHRPGAEHGFGRDALYAFRHAHYGGANATLVVTGAFDPERAESMIRDAFGGWPRGHEDPPVATTPRPRTDPVFVGVQRDAGAQMKLSISYPSPGGIDGQQAARLVVTELLSSAAADVRDSLGATYGVVVHRDERRGPSQYELTTAVDSARAGEALAALRAGIDGLRRGDDFDVRFVTARRRVMARLVAGSAGPDELAQRLGTIARFGLRPDYYQQLVRQVAALSTGQVKTLIASELDASGEVVVAMADRDTLTAAFAAAGITGFTLVEPTAH